LQENHPLNLPVLNEKVNPSLAALFSIWAGQPPQSITPLSPAGSHRQYCRLQADDRSAIGTYNPNPPENAAFLGLAAWMKEMDLPVPKIYGFDAEAQTYLQEDLGDHSLFTEVQQQREAGSFPEKLYQQALEQLLRFQLEGAKSWDFSQCYPPDPFDVQAMRSDLHYFKYYFLRPAFESYQDAALEADFEKLLGFLAQAETGYLMYRDFQARNIMLHEGKPYFIDFQGARPGPLPYDVVSLLFQAKARIAPQQREKLFAFYLDRLSEKREVDREQFRTLYQGFALIRTLQVLGAYGYRGLFERKSHFLESIPYALDNLAWLVNAQGLPLELPELQRCAQQLIDQRERWAGPRKARVEDPLRIRISSFSYKRGLPEGHPEHGGGFVFDCRSLHNPGRYAPYKELSGLDPEVQAFLQQESRVEAFLADVIRVVEPSVERYLQRGFDSLEIHFGCTGGQHRSVYCAERMTAHLRKRYGLAVALSHRERGYWENLRQA
jgi:aminoglycoside/choline kinase family phosphotransferase